ncbi:MAG: thioredoxin family protein [Chloroflexota bacterium]
MLTIKVLGSGCANCKQLEKIARQAVAQLAIEAEVLKVTEYDQIIAHGVISTPGLVINEKVVSSGKVPTSAEVISWLATALEQG